MSVKKIAVLFFAFVFALSLMTAPRSLYAEELIEVGPVNNLFIKIDAGSINWSEDKVSFNYIALPRTAERAKLFDDDFKVKGTASAQYEVIVDLLGDTYVVNQITLKNAQGTRLTSAVDKSGSQKIERSLVVSRCMDIITEQKPGLSLKMALEIGRKCVSAGQNAKAIPFLEIPAETNIDDACYLLGVIYYGEKEYKKAKEYFETAYEGMELGKAASMLGYMYYNAAGVERDYEKAMAYFRESAKNGSYSGYRMLGYAYYEGRAVKKSSKKAREYLTRAIELGDTSEETMKLYTYVDDTIKTQQMKDKAQIQAIFNVVRDLAQYNEEEDSEEYDEE